METDRQEHVRKRLRFNSIQELMDYIDREAARRTEEAKNVSASREPG